MIQSPLVKHRICFFLLTSKMTEPSQKCLCFVSVEKLICHAEFLPGCCGSCSFFEHGHEELTAAYYGLPSSCNLTLDLGSWGGSGVFLTEPQAKINKEADMCFQRKMLLLWKWWDSNWNSRTLKGRKNPTLSHRTKKNGQNSSRKEWSEKNHIRMVIFSNAEDDQNIIFEA